MKVYSAMHITLVAITCKTIPFHLISKGKEHAIEDVKFSTIECHHEDYF